MSARHLPAMIMHQPLVPGSGRGARLSCRRASLRPYRTPYLQTALSATAAAGAARPLANPRQPRGSITAVSRKSFTWTLNVAAVQALGLARALLSQAS
jgi:hypothetical protein